MKNYADVVKRIKLLSSVVGLPVNYASDLDVYYDSLKSYEGERFLLILRLSGAQLCKLDGMSDTYRADKLTEFQFYYSQVRDAQFYYYDGEDLAAISPLQAIEMIGEDPKDDECCKGSTDCTNVDLTAVHNFNKKSESVSFKAHINITWDTDDVRDLIDRKHYVFTPSLNNVDLVKILLNVRDNNDANVGINWDVVDSTIKELYGDRLVKSNQC